MTSTNAAQQDDAVNISILRFILLVPIVVISAFVHGIGYTAGWVWAGAYQGFLKAIKDRKELIG